MALFKEIMDSRSGATRGAGGSHGENRLIRVLAEDGIHPYGDYTLDGSGNRLAPDPRGLVEIGYAPRGSWHPWDQTLRVTDYTVVTQRAPGHWVVRVHYGRPGVAQPVDWDRGWKISVQGASVTHEIWEELPFGVGGAAAVTEARVIGTPRYEKAPVTPGTLAGGGVAALQATHYVDVYDEDTHTEVRQALVKTTAIEPMPQQVEYPAMQMTISRIQPNFSLRVLPELAKFSKAINATPWWFAAPGHIVLVDMAIDSIERDMAGQFVAGEAWQVRLSFFWSSIALSPKDLVNLWVDDKGAKHVVYGLADNKKAVSSFRIARQMHFGILFQILLQSQ